MVQGYLVISEQGEVRLRKEAGSTTLTIKGAGTLSRPEENYLLESNAGRELLWPLIIGASIEKERYRHLSWPHTFEFDVHHGHLEGYICVEVEFDTVEEAKAFVLPDWIKDAVEVTEDKRYKAKNLAKNHKTIREDLGL